MGNQRDRKTAFHLCRPHDQRFQPEAPLLVLNRQERPLLEQFVVEGPGGRSSARRSAGGFDLGNLDRRRVLRRGAGHGNDALGQCGRWFALGRGERIGYRPFERGEAGIDLRQRLGESFQWQFERGLRRFDFDHRRRRQLAHKLSVSAKFDHHQFRADDDGARVAAQHRLRD